MINLQGYDRANGVGRGVVNCGAVTRKVRVSLTRFFHMDSQSSSLSLVIRMSTFLLGQGQRPSHRSFISEFQEEKEGQSALPVPAISQVPLTPNNPHVKVALLGGPV